jgi:hypothetical protein
MNIFSDAAETHKVASFALIHENSNALAFMSCSLAYASFEFGNGLDILTRFIKLFLFRRCQTVRFLVLIAVEL